MILTPGECGGDAQWRSTATGCTAHAREPGSSAPPMDTSTAIGHDLAAGTGRGGFHNPPDMRISVTSAGLRAWEGWEVTAGEFLPANSADDDTRSSGRGGFAVGGETNRSGSNPPLPDNAVRRWAAGSSPARCTTLAVASSITLALPFAVSIHVTNAMSGRSTVVNYST